MKRLINKCLNPLGYEVKRIINKHNISYYQNSYPADSMKRKRFYNIGGGGFYHPYWTNVDYISEWYASNNKKTSQGIHYDLFSKSPIRFPNDYDIKNLIRSTISDNHLWVGKFYLHNPFNWNSLRITDLEDDEDDNQTTSSLYEKLKQLLK